MKIFVSNNIVLFVLVVTTTIDASRIFYLPLPKIHPTHQQIETPKIKEETTKKPISDEFIPPSAIEQEEIEKRGENFDWEALIDKEAATKRRITVNEIVPESFKQLGQENQVDEPIENKVSDDSEQLSVNKHSQINDQRFPEEPWFVDHANARAEYLQSNAALNSIERKKRRNDTLFIVIVGTCCVVGFVGLVAAAIFWYKIQKRAEAAVDAEYPSYGVTGPVSSGSKISPSSTMSDRKLAQSAQMFHYQQQRQQMMAQEKAHLDAKPVHSDDSDDEAPGGGDYTVYECPGLAPTGEMEVRNPLFAEPDSSMISPTSSSHPATNNHFPQPSTSISSSSPPKEKSLP
ncbi:unnamed protein product [Rotaria sp. Silwood2]|nr:unnamed protein product [Rotaria sp. Silwood2]CAF2846090.1 unnamed protein product [Rotaria sp. Silwood2]CAF2866991.1 unnamed protein product [Rotaria sp. Silwood2]CAF3242883.1 unnamed protein product [Rotaria sp. Silwood2]